MKTTEVEIAEFKPGLYGHWKGGLYRALFLAQDSTNRPPSERYPNGEESTQEPVVVYLSLSGGTTYQRNIYTRELWQWNELVPKYANDPVRLTPRFSWVGP